MADELKKAEMLLRGEDEPMLTEEEEKVYRENIEYALSLARFYPDVEEGELSSIAYAALARALKGYSMNKNKSNFNKDKAALHTLISRIMENEVNRYRAKRTKDRSREVSVEVLSPNTEQGEEGHSFEETVEDLKSAKVEDVARWAVIKEEMSEIFNEEDMMIVDLLVDGQTISAIKNAVNAEFSKSYTFQRYLRHIKVNLLPKLQQVLSTEFDEVELGEPVPA